MLGLAAAVWLWIEAIAIVLGPGDPLILRSSPVARDVASQLLRGIFAVGVAGVALRVLAVSSPRDWLRISRPGARDLAYVVLGVVLLIVAALGSTVLIQNVLGWERTTVGATLSNAVLWSRVVTLLLLVGPAEEVVFRGVIQQSLHGVVGRWPAIILAGGLFGILHFDAAALAPGDLLWLVALGVLGVVLGWVYARTDNLVVPALAHGSFNSVTTLLPLLLG